MRTRRRFGAEFKVRLVLDVLTGVQSQAAACRKHSLSPNLLAGWKATFLERAHTVFQDEASQSAEQARIDELERVLGRLTLENEVLKKQRPDKELETREFLR
jgi:transposase